MQFLRFLPLPVSALMLFGAGSAIQGQTLETHSLKFFGDFRLRYERTAEQEPTSSPEINNARNRAVVRLRAGVTREINGLLTFGARVATGSLDDPNTADVTLGAFVDDLEVNLDRLFLELTHRNLFLTGGKFANPFLGTDLVWDGDVNPQGIAAAYTFSNGGRVIPKITGIYSIVDEQTINPDSYMWGGQMQLSIDPGPDWSLHLGGAYYDYAIRSLANADAGDTQSNYLTPDGAAYVSDFDMLDVIIMIEFRGLGVRYPLRFVHEYVKNLGAATNEDQGFSLDFYLGRVSGKQDLRFQYGYSVAETDAILAAFSHDNTTFATNYMQHTLAIDHVVLENTILNMTYYIYRRDRLPEAGGKEDDFISRLRLNVSVNF